MPTLSLRALTAVAVGCVNLLITAAPATGGPVTTGAGTMATCAQSSSAGAAGRSWGVVQPLSDLQAYAAADLTRVTLEVGWDRYEPAPGRYDTTYIASLRTRAAAARAAGLDVVLDPGLQYPPAWVFELPGETRFVNQYGDVWHGGLSEDVPNAVFNPAVRSAELRHLRRLAQDLGPTGVTAVRVGGLLTGELRYPPSRSGDHQGSIWAFDAQAQAHSPVPGWRPGSGTREQAWAGLTYYFRSLARYESALLQTARAGFPDAELQLLLPSWGLRPGHVMTAVRNGLDGSTPAERGDMIAYGLDWNLQLDVLRSVPGSRTAYVTWLDAPSFGPTPQDMSPVEFVSGLAAARQLRVAGENTGGGGEERLEVVLQRAASLDLSSVMWMSGPALVQGPVELRHLSAAVRRDSVNASQRRPALTGCRP